jgi:hypothetical protein
MHIKAMIDFNSKQNVMARVCVWLRLQAPASARFEGLDQL